jgi:hypothetical protein
VGVLNRADFTEPLAEPTRMLGQIPREIAIRSAHSAIQVTGPPRGSEWDRGCTRDGEGLSCAPHNHPEAHRVPRYCGTGLTPRLSLGEARVPSETSSVVFSSACDSTGFEKFADDAVAAAHRRPKRRCMVRWSRPPNDWGEKLCFHVDPLSHSPQQLSPQTQRNSMGHPICAGD